MLKQEIKSQVYRVYKAFSCLWKHSTQHLIEALRLEIKLTNTNPAQQLSYVQAVSRDTTCHLSPELCHHPRSPLVTQDLPWHLHLRHNPSLLNFHPSAQHSSSTDLPVATQQVWVFPGMHSLSAGEQILHATRDVQQKRAKNLKKAHFNELWFTFITLFKPFLMLKSSRNTQRPVISQHWNNLTNTQRLC